MIPIFDLGIDTTTNPYLYEHILRALVQTKEMESDGGTLKRGPAQVTE